MSNNPINRLNFFFDEKEFEFQKEIGLEYLNTFLNTNVNLYKVDIAKTEPDDIYGEGTAEEIVLKPPVSVLCLIKLTPSENKSYNSNNTLRYKEYGTLTLSVFSDTLSQLGIDINYGDYVGYQVQEDLEILFQVFDDDLKNFENTKTFGGYKSYYRTILAAPVDKDEVKITL